MPGGVVRRLFPPHHDCPEKARLELSQTLLSPPAEFNLSGVRWRLKTISQACSWLKDKSVSGVWRILRSLSIRLKRSRFYTHSPDRHYAEKLSEIQRIFSLVAESTGRFELVFLDELTFFQRPTRASAYSLIGKNISPLAYSGTSGNKQGSIIGSLNGITGQVTASIVSKCGTTQLIEFYQKLVEIYPQAETIYVVEDNSPIHHHPKVLANLADQETPFDLPIPPSWKNLRVEKVETPLPIQLVPLPTYASWCNPIEKLWRWLKQEVLHLHRQADNWNNLRIKIKQFLAKFANGSTELMKYVGLTTNSKLFGDTIAQIKDST